MKGVREGREEGREKNGSRFMNMDVGRGEEKSSSDELAHGRQGGTAVRVCR